MLEYLVAVYLGPTWTNAHCLIIVCIYHTQVIYDDKVGSKIPCEEFSDLNKKSKHKLCAGFHFASGSSFFNSWMQRKQNKKMGQKFPYRKVNI